MSAEAPRLGHLWAVPVAVQVETVLRLLARQKSTTYAPIRKTGQIEYERTFLGENTNMAGSPNDAA